MIPAPFILSCALLAFAVPALSTPLSQPGGRATCGFEVDISNPLLPFLDYPAFRSAARDAVVALEEFSATGRAPAKQGEALTCDRIRVRKEWRQLTRDEKKAYILAEKCLMKAPNYGLTSNETYTLHDGLTGAHAQGFIRFHAGAKFLIFHRWFVWMHGNALEKECGYTGPVPYWDYTLDSEKENPYDSEVFSPDPEIGFGDGGSVAVNELGGRAGGYIVENGAFAHYRPNLPKPHYLVRNFTPDALYNPDNKYGVGLKNTYNKAARERVLSAKTFWEFETMIDGLDEPAFRSLHNSVHFMIGGDAQSFNWLEGTPWNGREVFGANDPLFYLHHGNVDHVFWEWQNKAEFNQFDYSGGEGAPDSFCDAVPTNNMGPEIPVALALKTEWYPQCYTYEY